MQTIQLYNFNRPDGGMTVTPVRPSEAGFRTDYVRLVADDGKAITDGKIVACCIDVRADDAGGWTDCDGPEEGGTDCAVPCREAGMT